MKAAAKTAVNSDYNVLARNCIDVASDALKAGNFDPGYSRNNFLGIENKYLTSYTKWKVSSNPYK